MNTEFALAYLRVIAPDGAECAVAIAQSLFYIGCAPHNELLLVGQHISRCHACLRLEGAQVLLVDLGSEHGTWIGMTRLEAKQPHLLDYLETFRIGPYRLRVEPVSGAPPPRGLDEEKAVFNHDAIAAANEYSLARIHSTFYHHITPI